MSAINQPRHLGVNFLVKNHELLVFRLKKTRAKCYDKQCQATALGRQKIMTIVPYHWTTRSLIGCTTAIAYEPSQN